MLPSPYQILEGIVSAQIHQFSSGTDSASCQYAITSATDMWKRIFSLNALASDMSKPLTPQILSDPDNEFVKTLVYIYSMESFLYVEMNKASRNKDDSKIKYYGPFAAALGFIVHNGNSQGGNKVTSKVLYRGFQVSSSELEEKFKVNQYMNLQGFASTTYSKDRALGFALWHYDPTKAD